MFLRFRGIRGGGLLHSINARSIQVNAFTYFEIDVSIHTHIRTLYSFTVFRRLVHLGYGYTKMCASTLSGITTWRCALNQSYPHLKCRAKCYTKQVGVFQKVKQIGDHTHPKKIEPQKPQQNGKKKIKAKPKSKAKPRPKPKKKVNQESKSIKLQADIVEELKN